jgi:hypothetical protein
MPRTGRPRLYTECDVCFAPLVPQRAWYAATPAERREMAADGYRKQVKGPRCQEHADRPPTPPRTPPETVVHELPMLRGDVRFGMTLFWSSGRVTWRPL